MSLLWTTFAILAVGAGAYWLGIQRGYSDGVAAGRRHERHFRRQLNGIGVGGRR